MSTVEVEIDQVLVTAGQRVEPDSVIASVAADKVDFDVEAGVAGVVEELLLGAAQWRSWEMSSPASGRTNPPHEFTPTSQPSLTPSIGTPSGRSSPTRLR